MIGQAVVDFFRWRVHLRIMNTVTWQYEFSRDGVSVERVGGFKSRRAAFAAAQESKANRGNVTLLVSQVAQ